MDKNHPPTTFQLMAGGPALFTSSVYKFVERETFANDLVNGKILISTLESCRKSEDPGRGDALEGYQIYNSGYINGDGTDTDLVKIAARAGIKIDQTCKNITVNNCTGTNILQDAFVYCTTLGFSPKDLGPEFGNYCVEITDRRRFFELVTRKLLSVDCELHPMLGAVRYSSRHYVGLEPHPGPMGFVKPPDPYARQREFRMLWIPVGNRPLEPFLLEVPEIKELCFRIS